MSRKLSAISSPHQLSANQLSADQPRVDAGPRGRRAGGWTAISHGWSATRPSPRASPLS